MKVLMISHTYVVETNQKKLEELSKFDDIDLSLIVPKQWKHLLKTYQLDRYRAESYNIIPTKTFYNGDISKYFYHSLSKTIYQLKPDIIYIEEEPWAVSTFQAMLLGNIINCKTIFFTWENIYCSRLFPFPHFLFERYTLKHADYAIAGNRDAKDILIRKGFKNPIKILPQLGVDPEVFKKSETPHLLEELRLKGFVIGFVGRIVKEKGILTLVKAASKLKDDYTILLVGCGPLKPTIIEQARELRIRDKIVFVDTVPHHEVPQYLNYMDVLVLPSLTPPYYKEQFGHILIEAMSCEVPVIGSTSGEIPNVISDVGLVFEGGNAEQLADMLSLLIENEKYRTELAKKGRERVIKNYTWDKIAKETYKVYQELIC